MIIWITALILVVAMAALGYTMGAVRTGIGTIGLLLGAFLAGPLAPKLYAVLEKVGASHLQALYIAPLIILGVITAAGNFLGVVVHKHVDTYYKYRAPDYVLTLWERCNERFGAVLGGLNGVIFFFILCIYTYVLGYPASMLSTGEEDPFIWRTVVKACDGLKSTKMIRTIAAFNPTPQSYYNACDTLGMMYQNPLLLGRLTSYPPLTALGEREEFKPIFEEIAKDPIVLKKLLDHLRPPVADILGMEKVQPLVKNKALMSEIFKLDFNDLSNHLATGSSPLYSNEKILGRWIFNLEASYAAQRKLNPNLTALQAWRLNQLYAASFSSASIIGMMNNQMVLKTVDSKKVETPLKGSWAVLEDGKYEIKWSDSGPWENVVEIQGSRMTTKYKGPADREPRIMVFDRE